MAEETRKERNIRKETQRRIDAGDTSSYVQKQIKDNPNTFTLPRSSGNQGPPGSGPGSQGNINDPKDDWIGQAQSSEQYYSPGGQGTTNVNISNPAGGNYNADAAAEALALANAAGKKRFNIQDTFDFLSKFSPMVGIGKGFGAFIDSLIKSPKAKQFTNPNDLAIIRSLFTNEQGEVDQNKLDDYYDQYKVTIGEGLTSDKASGEAAKFFKEQGIVDNEKAFQDFQKAIMGASPTGVEGMESELRLDPVNYYTNKDGGFNIPQTTGGLEKMAANLTFDDIANSGLSGAQRRRLGYELQQAREAGRDRDGSGGQSGIMTAAPPPVVPDPDDPIIPQDPIRYPGIPPAPTIPKYPGSVITDYTQLGLPNIYGNQQMPTYGYANFNQRSQPVGLKDYLENLRQRFGIG